MKPFQRSTIVLDYPKSESGRMKVVCTFTDQKRIVEMVRENPQKIISIIREAFTSLSNDFDVVLKVASENDEKSGLQRTPPQEDEEEKRKRKEDAVWTRKYAPGFIGGKKIAQKATIDEVQMLIDLNNKIAELDRQLLSLAKMRKNIVQGIREG